MSESLTQQLKIVQNSAGCYPFCIVSGYITIDGLYVPLTNTLHIKFKTPIFYKEFEITFLVPEKSVSFKVVDTSALFDWFIVPKHQNE